MIEIKQLRKISTHGASINIDELIVEPGEIVVILGDSDLGIASLFDLLIGATPPSSGTIRLGGIDPMDQRQFSGHVGVLFKEDCLYIRQSAYSNLALTCQLYGLPTRSASDMLGRIGMVDQADKKLSKLNPGLRRRLALGRAFLHHPENIILNEPFARCDRDSIQIISDFLRSMLKAGISILVFAEHDDHLLDLSDRFYILRSGSLQAIDLEIQTRKAEAPFFIPVKLEDKIRLVNPGDIFYAESVGDRASLVTIEGRMPTQFTLSELENRLSRSGFFRAHRSYLVNLQHVSEVIPFTRNSYSLRLDKDDLPLIPLSRSASSELRGLLGY